MRRIGVYVCGCGGNISDYVDVERVVAAVADERGVVVARTAMFTCSDATQQEIVADIREQALDGMVIASCSPALHTPTFREVARRAGLNPHQYTQVNLREQCSWTHTDDPAAATGKAIRLVRAGIARTRLSAPLQPVVVETVPRTLVIGGGIAGLRAALGLAEVGIDVVLVEREPVLGGWAGQLGRTYPYDRAGDELIARLIRAIEAHPRIAVFTKSELVAKSGTFGNCRATIRVDRDRDRGASVTVDVGSIIVATGFDTYAPEPGEFGYGTEGVLTLPEFERLLDGEGPLIVSGRQVQSIAYVYCVGSRRPGSEYCSRYCCTAAVHASLTVFAKAPTVRQYHLYRDLRTYGKNELLYAQSRRCGSIYVRFAEDNPPTVTRVSDGNLRVVVRDLLTQGAELAIDSDLVVLVTGVVPRENADLTRALKLPVGRDGFYNEIHPKLRPVETIVDGVYIAGACQAPRTAAESAGSALAAVAKSAAVLKRRRAELEPLVATVDPSRCTWCAACEHVCPYDAIKKTELDGRAVAAIDAASCKGCGACGPVCPADAIDLAGHTDAQVRAMISALQEAVQ